jgi:hypothetical protein
VSIAHAALLQCRADHGLVQQCQLLLRAVGAHSHQLLFGDACFVRIVSPSCNCEFNTASKWLDVFFLQIEFLLAAHLVKFFLSQNTLKQ